MISQGASKINISFIVEYKEAEEVVKGLHMDFFEPLSKPASGN
jgi:aspartate kinase